MSSKSYPSPQALRELTDKDLRAYETPARLPRRQSAAFIPSLPVRVVQAIVAANAEIALPLVLAVHRQLTMKKQNETALTAAIWTAAGSPSQRKREAILRKLKCLPAVIVVTKARTPTSYYRIGKGAIWSDADDGVGDSL
jgi:hypothetical protein